MMSSAAAAPPGPQKKSHTFEKNQQETEIIRPCTIILVDDDQDDRLLTMRALKDSESVKETLTLPDGADFINYLKEKGFYDRSVLCLNPILVLLDLNMPRLNGFEVLKEIKSDSFLREVPVIVLTSIRTDSKILQAMELGAEGYLLKPLKPQGLKEFIKLGWSWPPRDMWY